MIFLHFTAYIPKTEIEENNNGQNLNAEKQKKTKTGEEKRFIYEKLSLKSISIIIV